MTRAVDHFGICAIDFSFSAKAPPVMFPGDAVSLSGHC
jgi:hypothetical protein